MNPPPFASILASLVALSACASSNSGDPIDASSMGDGAGNTDAADPEPDTDGGGNAAMCPAGQFATGIAANGTITCAPVDAATATAVRARCSIYAGTRDSCNGCTDPPAKWSRTGPLGCTVGAGGGNACVSTLLDDAVTPVSLAALDFDGDVNGDDKFYATMHCIAVPRDPRPAPCQPDWAISFKSGDSWMCTPISEAAVAYVGGQCSVYTGWRVFQDRCAGCHGPGATGTANAPNLLERVQEMGPRRFVGLVLRRYDWALPAGELRAEGAAREALIESVLERRTGALVMPAWQTEPEVNAHIVDLYAWLSARAQGTQGPGRPSP